MRLRVILDTNVLISGLLIPAGSVPAYCLDALLSPDVDLFVSANILAEYKDVLSRKRLKLSMETASDVYRRILTAGKLIVPTIALSVCSDPRDNRFLEVAQASDAHYLVTGNTRHFPSSFGICQIITPRQFLNALDLTP